MAGFLGPGQVWAGVAKQRLLATPREGVNVMPMEARAGVRTALWEDRAGGHVSPHF